MAGTTPYGLQVLADGGVPRTFTAKAMSVISGGEFVVSSGVAANYHAVGSNLDTYAWNDIAVTPIVNGGAAGTESGATAFNGICLRNVASGGKAVIMTRGIILAMAGGSVLPGKRVECIGNDKVQTVSSGVIPASLLALNDTGTKTIGRALTMAYSGTALGKTYALIDLQA